MGTTPTLPAVPPTPRSVGKIAAALAKAQAEFKPVPKNKTAKVTPRKRTDGSTPQPYEYKYADLADILSMALPILAKNEIAIMQPTTRKDGKLLICTHLIHSSGEFLKSDGLTLPEGLAPQEFGSIVTYWRRYDLAAMCGIAPDEDEDGKLATDKHKDDSGGKKPQSKNQTDTKSTAGVKCKDCGNMVVGVKANGKDIPAATIVEKSVAKFKVPLCWDCAVERTESKSERQEPSGELPEGHSHIKAKIVSADPRKITTKKGGKKTVYDLKVTGGVEITDWNESHFDYYKEADKGTPISLIVETKQNGRYVNRDVVALLSIGEMCVEDEQGNKIEDSQEQAEQEEVQGQPGVFDGDDDTPFE